MTNLAIPMLPGRLGTPDMQLRDDPRADPRMIAAMAALGLDVAGPPAPIDASAPLEQLRAFAAEAEVGFGAAFEALITSLPPVSGVMRYRNGSQSANGMYSPNMTRCILSYVPMIFPSGSTSAAELNA